MIVIAATSSEPLLYLRLRVLCVRKTALRRAGIPVSCGGENTKGWGHAVPIDQAAEEVGALWAKHITSTAENLPSEGKKLKAGQATTCSMSFNTGTYEGTSTSGYHGEIDCLNQAHDAGAQLPTGTFDELSNPCCFICAVTLHAVGVQSFPAIAHNSKEYANYQVPSWLWDDEGDEGALRKLMGETAWKVWTQHVSSHTRSQAESRLKVVVQMITQLSHYK